MDLRDQIIQEYLATGCGYRQLAAKYGISRTVISRWVLIYQEVHNLPATDLQRKHYREPMKQKKKKKDKREKQDKSELLAKIAMLEKQLKHENLRSEVLDTLINVAEKELNINIRKKPGTQQSSK